MKKIFKYACAAVAATLSFTSCSNEVDMFKSSAKGHIALNLNTEDPVIVSTRGTVDASATDWYVKVNDDEAITVAALATKAYAASTSNTLSVYNYVDMSAALAANSGRGAAYWTGTSESFAIEAGKTTNVSVACGAAQNAEFDVAFNESFTNVANTGYKVVVSQGDSRSLEFTAAKEAEAFYNAGKVTYTLTATVNGNSVNVSKDVALAAGTKTLLTVKANTNGTISLSITYGDMTNAESQEVTIDAATGAEAQANS